MNNTCRKSHSLQYGEDYVLPKVATPIYKEYKAKNSQCMIFKRILSIDVESLAINFQKMFAKLYRLIGNAQMN
jgi:hypothetical protein